MKLILVLLVLTGCLAGCTTVTVHEPEKLDVHRFRRVFVDQPLNENHHVDEIMADEIRRLGVKTDSGPLTMMADETDAIVFYDARWAGDFTQHLIDLEVTVRTARGQKVLAEARYYQPTIRPKPAEFVIHTLVTRLFAP